MAIRQSNLQEIRYLKRKNLEQEAKIIGNMYRDQIRQQGIDCRYYKLNTKNFEEFKGIIDQNTILRQAYGYECEPDYSVSADMITFMEVENDIFQLNKYGLNPNMDVNFVFDSNDFACALATKLGQYKEYPIEASEIVCEVPEFNSQTSADVFPYALGLGYNENFRCGILSGKLSVELSGYEEEKEMTVMCHPYEHTDFKVEFPVNNDILKSFTHKIKNDEFIDSMIFLKFKVNKVKKTEGRYDYILRGKLQGSILFYDISQIGKYVEKIHPEVGDLVTIDFPDENNREQYEITEAIDKQLTPDGINPFLHKYVWKCKARRYVNSYEDMEQNEANDRLEEKLKFDQVVQEEVAKKISIYDDNEDAVYGGYENHNADYDHMKPNPNKHEKYEYIEDGTAIDLMKFECGSKLVTNGYDLLFLDKDSNAYRIAADIYLEDIKKGAYFEQDLRWLKANDYEVVFVNIEERSFKIVQDETATADELQICLNSLFDKTLDVGNINKENDNFFKFKGTKTLLFATETNLFCRLASGKMYKIV